MTVHVGDCRTVLATMPADSVDAVVTDPPYGIEFMGKEWDTFKVSKRRVAGTGGQEAPFANHAVAITPARNAEFERWCSEWAVQVLRVLKPGAHLLAFGGTRTYHRMVCAIEDAGFEIRDCLMWIYGSGFPKSLDVSKAIDKAAGAERSVVIGTRHRNVKPFDDENGWNKNNTSGDHNYMAPATDAARRWQGWGTALKPAYEPIVLARKPLVGTVAANVQQYGTGAINVDGCRIQAADQESFAKNWDRETTTDIRGGNYCNGKPRGVPCTQLAPLGRWPANVLHDGSEDVVGLFPQSSITGKRTARSKAAKVDGTAWLLDNHESTEYTDSGSAARFFYTAKASRRERGEGNTHPTVKPLALMRYLVRLITPPDGLILDPFAGSGTTGIAAIRDGFRFIGVELNADHAAIAERRIRTMTTLPIEPEDMYEHEGAEDRR